MSSTELASQTERLPLWKRGLDLGFILVTLPLTLPVGAVIWLLILVREGTPVIYRARRSGQNGQVFLALKFRTMREVAGPDGDIGVSGGNKTFRVTPFCARLRRTRLDELPQLLNVLKGEMTLVGPRPPDPRYVQMKPDLYARVLRSRPGLTGLATLNMHRFEDRVLKACATHEETEAVYLRRCVPRKARLDLIYQHRMARPGAVCFDLVILLRSFASVLR
jgi:lipopolysaccharide/colanic/teichoic acid biosynthesis glycosyltransferase